MDNKRIICSLRILALSILMLLQSACIKKDNYGYLTINMAFHFDGVDIRANEPSYINAAGELLEINEIKCFISEVCLIGKDDKLYPIIDNEGIRYFDNTLPSTLLWSISDPIEACDYKALRFCFGLADNQNITGKFSNPPEVNFAWPTLLGGGYHYMQINGRWWNGSMENPLTLHTGRGQLRDSSDNIIGYVDNSFRIEIPISSFTLNANKTQSLTLVMDVARWFDTPNLYMISYYGNAIMQNQEAQSKLRANGENVFSISSVAADKGHNMPLQER